MVSLAGVVALSGNRVQIFWEVSKWCKIMARKSENEPFRKIGYARVSTADQSPDMQIAALKKYGVEDRYIFMDRASGGGDFRKRPNFVRAMKYAQHEGTEFVVWKLDRLGRTLGGILETLKILSDRGVNFVSLTERVDTTGPMGKAMIHLLAVFAELERDLIRERTLAGIERARERGEQGGRPRAMTDERIAKAEEMLAQGDRGNTVWEELRKLGGPKISRSAYYNWQQEWDQDNKPPDAVDK